MSNFWANVFGMGTLNLILFYTLKTKNLRPGGSVGVGVVGGSVGTASDGIKSQTSVCKNVNSSTATKLSSFFPFSATITTYIIKYQIIPILFSYHNFLSKSGLTLYFVSSANSSPLISILPSFHFGSLVHESDKAQTSLELTEFSKNTVNA